LSRNQILVNQKSKFEPVTNIRSV